jgi:hypothetical protein
MRPVIVVALLGTGLSMVPADAQSSSAKSDTSESSRAAAHKKPSAVNEMLFENGPERPKARAEARRETAHRANEKVAAEEAPDKAPLPAPLVPTVQAVPPGPPQKNLTGDEFGLIHVGSAEKEVLAVLGPPSSRVVVPDDNGHLRESFQYWTKGSPMGTVRLDNGRVVQIETKQK